MTNMPSNKNGFIFIMVMVFIVLAMIGTYSLYMLISSNYSVFGVKTTTKTEEYYAAMAGLRYAAVMLTDSGVIHTLATPATNPSTWSIKTSYPFLWNDLGLTSPHDVNITITKNADGTYTVQSVYN